MSKLLFDEQPLIVSRELAKLIGLNESIILQQIHYWLEINRKANKNFHDGRYWTYNSMKKWHENDFSFWSFDTVKRTFSSLEKKGYIISGNYNRQKFDQTKWYSIDYKALETLILPISAKCPNGIGQNKTMDCGKMPQPIPENNTENNLSENIQSYPIQSVLLEQDEKEKTDMIRYDTTSHQSAENENGQKNKESLRNATVTSDKHLPKPSAVKYNYTEVEEIIKNQILYDYLIEDNTARKDILDEIVFVITTTICTEYKDGYISMGEERVPAEAVRAVFFKLSSEHIEYFIDCFNRQTETITKMPPYIRKSLYYNYGTVSHHYTNRVHHDMPQLAERKL